jgi:repressor LexA
MINVGILHGDNVIVHKNNKASNDEIIVALLHKEYITVKKYIQESDIITLKSENNSMDPIVFNLKDIEIIGIVTGVFRVVE